MAALDYEMDERNQEEQEEERTEESKFSFFQACSLNTMNMFGTGPLITIPYCLAAVTPHGPYAMIGYGNIHH